MTVAVVIQRGLYLDSIFLMRVADRIGHAPGIRRAAAVMGTPANREALVSAGYSDPSLSGARADDLVIAIDGESADAVAAASGRMAEWLAPESRGAARAPSIDEAVRSLPDANVGLVAVPGEHAAAAARQLLEHGLHVFVFSSGVSLADELALKRYAHEHGLLVMGPDCGTAMVGGAGFGFANAVRRGPIGIVGAAGTGLQEIATLVHRAGSGISQAIGTGGRDLTDAVGGITAFDALDALAEDDATRAIVVVAKRPGQAALTALVDRAPGVGKPVVICALGASVPAGAGYARAATLDEAASHALALCGGHESASYRELGAERVRIETGEMGPRQRVIRGLFSGGTLAYQAQIVLRDAGLAVRSNVALDPALQLADDGPGRGHSVFDLGAEGLTQGRPHPMIDPRLRRERIAREAADPEVALILIDVVLGHGAAVDPAKDLAGAIHEAREAARARGGYLAFVASVTGTEDDPQVRSRQVAELEAAGVAVADTAGRAASFAAQVAAVRAHAEAIP